WGRRRDVRIGAADWEGWVIDLSELEGRQSSGRFRFRFVSDNVGAFDGVYVDDFAVKCMPFGDTYTGTANEFRHVNGTSYAAPQVTGVAALLLSLDPSLSATDLRQRLLGSVDPLPSLAGKTATGGILNAAKALATVPVPPSVPASPSSSPLATDLQAL